MSLEQLFIKYQKDLLWMVNTKEGKSLLKCELSEEIVKVVPNAYFIKEGNQVTARFFTYPHLALFLPTLEKMLIADAKHYKGFLHYANIEKSNLPNIYLDTYTFNPRAGGSGSGRLQSSNAAFATARSGSNLALNTSIGQLLVQFTGGNLYTIDRDFHPFDTSSLPNLSISSAFVRYVGTADANDADGVSLHVVESTQASVNTLATSDWTLIGSVSFGSIAKASWNQSGNNDVNLNASGIAKIIAGGDTKLGAITDRDLNNSAPTGVNIFGISSVGTIVLSVTGTLGDSSYFM